MNNGDIFVAAKREKELDSARNSPDVTLASSFRGVPRTQHTPHYNPSPEIESLAGRFSPLLGLQVEKGCKGGRIHRRLAQTHTPLYYSTALTIFYPAGYMYCRYDVINPAGTRRNGEREGLEAKKMSNGTPRGDNQDRGGCASNHEPTTPMTAACFRLARQPHV